MRGAGEGADRAGIGAWMRGNLTTQGYCLTDGERRELAVGLRFSTGLCLGLVVVALALRSPAVILALAGIGAVASFAPRHRFDHLWNRWGRRLFAEPSLPPNPARRRGAFRVATVGLVAVGALLAGGATPAALVLGGLLVAACATVTATNLCLPSELFAWLEGRRAARSPITTTLRGEHR